MNLAIMRDFGDHRRFRRPVPFCSALAILRLSHGGHHIYSARTLVLMNPQTNSRNSVARACLLLASAVLALSACRQPASETPAQKSPGAATTATPAGQKQKTAADKLSDVAVRILNTAHRQGGVVLSGECGARGITEKYTLPHPVTLEPMDKALGEVAAKYQSIYWRQSSASGIRVMDATATAKLLRVRVREFRIVEDREPDGVMAVLWRMPEVRAFVRRSRVRFAGRPEAPRKAISPPMIVEVKNATVAEILDKIAAGYRADPPKVWVYQECGGKKPSMIDVRIR